MTHVAYQIQLSIIKVPKFEMLNSLTPSQEQLAQIKGLEHAKFQLPSVKRYLSYDLQEKRGLKCM